MTSREAFEQGYMRGMLKCMDAIHIAFRKHMETEKIEAMLRRFASVREAGAEADAFEESTQSDSRA